MLTVLGVLTSMAAIDYGIGTVRPRSGFTRTMLRWLLPVLGTLKAVLNRMRDLPVLGETRAVRNPTRFMLFLAGNPRIR